MALTKQTGVVQVIDDPGLEFHEGMTPLPGEPDAMVRSAIIFPLDTEPYYVGRRGWAEAMGVAVVQKGKAIRLSPISARSGKIVGAVSLPIGGDSHAAVLRGVADALTSLADVLEREPKAEADEYFESSF